MSHPDDAITAFIQIGDQRYPLRLVRGGRQVDVRGDGGALKLYSNLGDESRREPPYAFAEVNVCHRYECPATRIGKRSGPCNCGGRERWEGIVRQAGGEP